MARVLVACEFTGRVRDAFIEQGHDAYSVDLIDTAVPGPHFTGDMFDYVDKGWDLIVAHPPCTAIACAGNRHYAGSREREEGLEFVGRIFKLWRNETPKLAVENPKGVISTRYAPPDQYVEPYWFGDPWTKATGLWLGDLPPLEPTNVVDTYIDFNNRPVDDIPNVYLTYKQRREVTPRGLAKAMAQQWGAIL